MWHCIGLWFQSHEWLAVWAEGIALILIFVWDRFDAAKQHRETLDQIHIALQQIESSHNAERAWVLTELDGTEVDGSVRVVEQTSGGNAGDGSYEFTSVSARLICRNEGRSPAWIDSINGYCEIMNRASELPGIEGHKTQSFGWIGPLGPEKETSRRLTLDCPGHPRLSQWISIYVVIEYRDIFQNKRMTSLGYSVDMSGNIARQEGLPERNRNT